jgi:cold shock CspA family protein
VSGRVSAFDRAVGLGEVALDDGRTLGFHATAITDGSRSIELGTEVIGQLGADHGGQMIVRLLSPRQA